MELGANEYIVKAFLTRELIARIKIQFRGQTAPVRTLKAGGLELDRNSCRVFLNGGELTLTATEFRLLEFLITRPGVVFSLEQLLNAEYRRQRSGPLPRGHGPTLRSTTAQG